MRYTYPAAFCKNELGGYSVQFVDFENGYTDGDDLSDAIDMAAEVLYLLIGDFLQNSKQLPAPSLERVGDGVLLVSVEVNVEEYVVSTSEAARMLGVSSSRVRQMILTGQLSSKKSGRDNWVYLASLNELMSKPRKPGRPRKTAQAGRSASMA